MGNESRQLILSPQPSSRRELLKALRSLQLLFQSEHLKNEELLADREYLLELIELRNEQWARHVSLLQSRIDHVKTQELKMKEFNAAKLELLVDIKERKASSYKEYAELAETDLEDASTCIEALGHEITALKGKLNNAETTRPTFAYDSTEIKDLTLELKKRKHGYKALKSEKEAKIAEKENQIEALIAAQDFVRNQYKIMEAEYVAAVKLKNSDLDKSNEEVKMVKQNLQAVEASILEKDSIITAIKEEMAASISGKNDAISQLNDKFQASNSKKDDMISRLNGEIENLKIILKEKDQMISGLHTDVANYAARAGPICKPADSRTSRTLRSGTKRSRECESVSCAQPSANKSASGQRQHYTRSQGSASASTAETRILFSSSFKVPKLKNATRRKGIVVWSD
ncbi:GRIP and coiled-coil domain-containing protein 2 [Rhynchospora pubera]|uniref:GRIP and coiled-coil domain-containing protein 2 n=1 Tax=Rhynchospora pubera TaxID=906938 RepID=A0AAV8GV50_9POAL|nr:GRIP and coiled-coil domain-containing protein 2 [Rhynchospora pubera]